ncbi:hypothetical protein G7046_g890 [Stylonectria norvegica]|nr:hypothetical protein G7046_g890 [Stylonectria norvegica]
MEAAVQVRPELYGLKAGPRALSSHDREAAARGSSRNAVVGYLRRLAQMDAEWRREFGPWPPVEAGVCLLHSRQRPIETHSTMFSAVGSVVVVLLLLAVQSPSMATLPSADPALDEGSSDEGSSDEGSLRRSSQQDVPHY